MKDTYKRWRIAVQLLVCGLMLLTSSRVYADTFEYDDLNRLTKIIYDNGDYIEYEYDLAGNILNVFSPDIPPVAVNDGATVAEDAPATAIDVLINDSDSDGGPQSIDTVTQPPNGFVVITNDGADLTYTPAANYCNDETSTDNFTYTLIPADSTATVQVTVTCVNDPPEATDDAFAIDEDTQLEIAAPGALGNDSDVDGDSLTATLLNDVGNGTLIMNSDGSFTYTPNPDFNGADSYDYKVCDTQGACDTATANITVNPVNDAPVAADDVFATDEDTPLTIPGAGVMGNDSDVDIDPLTCETLTEPVNGTLSLNTDGSFVYKPNPNFYGTDSFTYTVADGNGASDSATVTVTVYPVNDVPTASDDTAVTDEDTPVLVDLLANDMDVDGNLDPTTAVIQSGPANGTLVKNGDGLFTYTPKPNFNGADNFDYQVCDTDGACDTATVNITVNPVNDAPTISLSIQEQTVQYSDGLASVTIAAGDIDSSPIAITANWTKDGGTPQEGLPDGLSLSLDSCQGDSQVSCDPILSGSVRVAVGSYVITISADDGEHKVSESTTLVVVPEDAKLIFGENNPTAVQVASPGGDSGEFDLTVQGSETLPDLADILAGAGNISLAEVSMNLLPVGPGTPVEGVCEVDPVSGEGYEAILTATCRFDAVPVNTYNAVASIGGNYFAGSSEDVLTVYDPSLGFATGGGWLYWPGTADKTNFGFTMKYSKNAGNVKGSLLVIRHLADGTIYRVKSNALYGLALGEIPVDDAGTLGWASFSGKATYQEPGWPEAIGNHEFVVYLEDHNEPGNGTDALWIEVHGKDGIGIPVMSMERPAVDNTEEIQHGNIIVPHS